MMKVFQFIKASKNKTNIQDIAKEVYAKRKEDWTGLQWSKS